MSEEREITGPELLISGVPPGWIIDRRKGTNWDVYILVPDTPLAHARRKLVEIRRVADEALDALKEVHADGEW